MTRGLIADSVSVVQCDLDSRLGEGGANLYLIPSIFLRIFRNLIIVTRVFTFFSPLSLLSGFIVLTGCELHKIAIAPFTAYRPIFRDWNSLPVTKYPREGSLSGERMSASAKMPVLWGPTATIPTLSLFLFIPHLPKTIRYITSHPPPWGVLPR